MQRNHPNRAFFFYFITSFSKPDFLFPFAPPFLRSPHQSSLSPAFPSVSLFFSPLRFLILLPALSARLSSALFFRGTTRPFLIALLSRSREIHPFRPVPRQLRCFSSSDFLTLRFLFPYPPLSTLTQSYPLQPLGELYPVNRGTLLVTVCNLTEDQTKRDPIQPPNHPSTYQPIYFTLPYPILSTYPLIPSHRMSSRKTHTWESTPRVRDRKKDYEVALSLRDDISRNKHYAIPLSGPS